MAFADMKLARYAEIEQRTRDVLARGYTYSGVTVSLSEASLVKYQSLPGLSLANVTIEAADPTQPPLVLSVLPGTFVTAVFTYVRQVYEAESAVKALVRGAVDQAALEQVFDTR